MVTLKILGRHLCFYGTFIVLVFMLYVLISILQVDEELEALLENGEGLSDEKQVVSLCRLMVRVETMEQRLTCVKLIQVGATFNINK